MKFDITLQSESKGRNRAKPKFKAKKGKAKAPKASGNLRSIMLKAIMPQLSGKRGDRLATAIKALDDSTVEQLLNGVTASVVNSIRKKKEAMGIKTKGKAQLKVKPKADEGAE